MNTVHRDKVFELIADFILSSKSHQEIYEYLEYLEDPVEFNAEVIKQEIFEFVQKTNQGVSNGYLSDIYHLLTGNKLEVIGEVADLYACDCCQLKTLNEKYGIADGGYDICDYCGWEDDGTTDIKQSSSVNQCTIEEKRVYIASNPNYFYKNKWKAH